MNAILGIDTASPAGIALAWLPDSNHIETVFFEGPQDHSRHLVPSIDTLLDGRRHEVVAIAVVTGPGSFAGLRVGIATAESLALGWSLPVYGLSTFDAIAAAVESSGMLTAIHPAGRAEVACQRYMDGVKTGDPFLCGPGDLRGEPRIVGEAAAAAGGEEVTAETRVAAAVRAVRDRIASGERPGGIEAFYLREPNVTRPRRTPLVAAGGHEDRGESVNG